jgi:hypothetical protein
MIVLATLAFCGCAGSTGGGSGGDAQNASASPAAGNGAAPDRMAATAANMPATAKPLKSAREHRNEAAAAKVKPARPTAANPTGKSPDVSVLKLDAKEVPAEVRAIEKMIDRRSALLADEVRIEVSKNYEWDVSLSGDGVAPQRQKDGGTVAEATGNARAYFRNLDIRARDKITIWRSGLGVAPFIKIWAKGGVSYIDTEEQTGKPRVKRANNCRIHNASIAFDEQVIGVPSGN